MADQKTKLPGRVGGKKKTTNSFNIDENDDDVVVYEASQEKLVCKQRKCKKQIVFEDFKRCAVSNVMTKLFYTTLLSCLSDCFTRIAQRLCQQVFLSCFVEVYCLLIKSHHPESLISMLMIFITERICEL